MNKLVTRKFFYITTVLLACLLAPKITVAQSIIDLGSLGGSGPGASVYGISSNGKIVVGGSRDASAGSHAYIWKNGVMTPLDPSGSFMSAATGISADGTVISGLIVDASYNFKPVLWVNGTVVELPSLASGATLVNGISADGRVAIGTSTNSSGHEVAVRWQNGTVSELGNIGGLYSIAYGASKDGSVIVGDATNSAGSSQAFRWTQASGMTNLGTLGGGSYSTAYAVSLDGRVVIGVSAKNEGNFAEEAFRWEDGVMVGLGNLGGESFTRAMNADGSVIVGTSAVTLGGTRKAFIWKNDTGMLDLSDVLADLGVDLSGWDLTNATAITPDGKIVGGEAQLNGNDVIYLANMATGGVTTPEDLSSSVQTIQQSGQQVAAVTRSYAPSGLFIAQNIPQLSVPAVTPSGGSAASFSNLSPAAGGARPSRLGAFLLGSVGVGHNNTSGNYQLNGTLGITMQISDDWNIGAGMIAGRTRSDLQFNGDSRLDALGGMAIASYVPYESPLRIFATAFAADLTVDNKRGYLNGSGLDYSRGGAGGLSYGGALRVGWEKELFSNQTTMMPYIEGRYSKTKMDGYSEQGGAFAASFSEQEDDYTASRLGLEFKHQLNEKTQLLFRPAWGHRFSGSGDGFTATTAGLTMGYAGQAGDRDWAEASVGASYRATEKLTFTTEFTTRTGDTSEPLASVTIGAFMKF